MMIKTSFAIKYRSVKLKLIALLPLWPLFIWPLLAQKLPEPLNPPRLVNDYAGLLTQQEFLSLEQKLRQYQDTTGTQIAVAIIKSLEGLDESDYAVRLALKWGVGQKGKNNGILILLALEERAVSIEVGYGLEASIPDITARRIIDREMIPLFRQGKYYEGLNNGINALINAAAGTYRVVPSKNKHLPIDVVLFMVVLMLIIFFIMTKGGKRGGRGGSFTAGWLLGEMMRGTRSGGFNDFSRGRGTFGGFGGGSFGGGGASGRW